MPDRTVRSRQEWLELLATVTGEGHVHGDTPEDAYDRAVALIERGRTAGWWKAGDVILDIGCGYGRLAIPLTTHHVRYVGVEPMAAFGEFCRRAFAPWPQFRFVHADLRNEAYNPQGALDPGAFVFPAEDESVDVCVFSSVLTHIETLEAAAHYLAESRRVLSPGGRVGCSWFRSPPHEPSGDAVRTVFREADIVELVRPFRVLHTEGGLSDSYHDQWLMVLQKR
jgi:SAM-dependent methyltransferase